MANEFRTLKGKCTNLVPNGPGYENVTLDNQVCTTVGALPGQPLVDGGRFLDISFDFSYSNVWKVSQYFLIMHTAFSTILHQNLGITIGFGVGFFIIYFLFTELNTTTVTENSVVLFRRGYKRAPGSEDEESGATNEKGILPEPDKKASKGTLTLEQTMTDTFSWQHLEYTVPIHGEADRKLLSNVSGYVAPGKLTALMGASGAGKTTLLNVLAQRTSIGVVTGDRFVNGQALPHDFQAQTYVPITHPLPQLSLIFA